MIMGSSNLAAALSAFLVFFVTTLTLTLIINPTYAQNSAQDFVDAHNSARQVVGVTTPVSWDETLEVYAQKYADQRVTDCEMVHSGGPYGENLFWGYGVPYSAADAVSYWVAEKQYYDHSNNTCATGHICSHYTQVLWADSITIGCARVTCNSGTIFIMCSYNPPGNYEGQRPY